jgi:hypothetical protein
VSPAQDLMDRLGAADPVADAERLRPDAEREADALLARLLATPAEPTRARPRRRWPRLAVATGLVAAVVFAALSLSDSDEGPTPNIVAKAVAALTQPDSVYHAVFIGRFRSTEFPEEHANPYMEQWHTTTGRLHWRTYAEKDGRRGRLVGDFAGQRRPGRLGGPALTYDARTNQIYETGFGRDPNVKGAPGADPFDPGRSLKQLQAEGRLKVAGEVELDGRRAYRLVSDPVKSAGGAVQRSEITVDAETYLPREQRLFVRAPNGDTTRVVWDYLKYERLPLNKKTSALLDFDPPAGAKCRPGTERLEHKGSLGFPNPCAR